MRTGVGRLRTGFAGVLIGVVLLSLLSIGTGPAASAETLSVGPPLSFCNRFIVRPYTTCTSIVGNELPTNARLAEVTTGLMVVTDPPSGTTPTEFQIIFAPLKASATTIHVTGDYTFLLAAGLTPAVSVGFCIEPCGSPSSNKLVLLQQSGPSNPTVAPLHVDVGASGTFPEGTVVRAFYRAYAATKPTPPAPTIGPCCGLVAAFLTAASVVTNGVVVAAA